MDLVLPGGSSASMKAVRRARQILFLILPRRAERLKNTGPQFLAFEQSVVDIRRLQSFLVSLAWRRSTKTPGRIIQKRSKEKQLNRASRGVKEWKFSNGELNCSLEDVEESVVDIGVTIDASWSARGWSASDAVVAAISVDTGKFCLLSTRGVIELTGSKIIISHSLPRKFVPVTCYLSKSYC